MGPSARAIGSFVALVVLGAARVAPAEQPQGDDAVAEHVRSEIDRSTPRRVVQLFLDATRAADFSRASYALDLHEIPMDARAGEAPALARKLKYVLANTLWIDPVALSDEPSGVHADGATTEILGEIRLGDRTVPVRLARVRLDGDLEGWVVSAATVRAIPSLYDEHGTGWIGERLPDWAHRTRFGSLATWQWIGLGLMLLVALPAGTLSSAGILFAARRAAARTRAWWDDLVVSRARGPLRVFLILACFDVLVRAIKLPLGVPERLDRIAETLFVACATWFALRTVSTVGDAFAERLTANQADPIRARGTRTFVAVVQRMVSAGVVLVAAALVFTQFEVVRRIGVSLLASAGVAGIALGFAAQKVLGNLLAGLQLSVAKPIRVGDQVRIQEEVGTVEEIGLTFVVIQTWDQRRLVLPITRLVEEPFENWTRTSSRLVGEVIVRADHGVPVDRVRRAFLEMVHADPDWDGQVAELVVLEVTDTALVLRGTASADAGDVFRMSCRLREGFVTLLQSLEGGRYLPRMHVALGTLSSD